VPASVAARQTSLNAQAKVNLKPGELWYRIVQKIIRVERQHKANS
jgi:hypothetical protein